MKRLMTALFSALVLSAFASTSAFAFDGVNWTWDKKVREHVDIWVDINVCVDPTGLVEVEKLQIFLGNVEATSKVAFVNNTLAELFTIGAVIGILTPSEISADSHVFAIHNATVDSSATAVANNISVTLLSDNPDNHVLIADITQFAYANVTAVSDVCAV